MVDVFIIDAVRTPRGSGRAGKGALAGCRPQRLTATALKAIVSRNGIASSDIGDVIWSTSTQKGRQGGNIARMSALHALTAAMNAQEQAAGMPPMYLDADNSRLQELHPRSHQGLCADAIATIEGISRIRLDVLAAESQRRGRSQ